MGSGRTGTLGARAERTALQFLVQEGLTRVSSNYRTRGGEIDLIMLDDGCIVFVEVRFRTSTQFSNPAVTIDARKQRKIIRTAAMFLARAQQYSSFAVRFDVVAISGAAADRVCWIQDAFRPQDSRL